MPKLVSQILWYGLPALGVMALASGGVYLYRASDAQQREALSIGQSISAQQASRTGGADTSSNGAPMPITQSGLNNAAVDAYTLAASAVADTDSFFSDAKGADPKFGISASPKTRASINALRQHINDALAAWKSTIESIADASYPNPTLITQADAAVTLLHTYIAQLQRIIDSLSPGQGLTQNEISQYQSDLAAARNQADAAAQRLASVEPEIPASVDAGASGSGNGGGQIDPSGLSPDSTTIPGSSNSAATSTNGANTGQNGATPQGTAVNGNQAASANNGRSVGNWSDTLPAPLPPRIIHTGGPSLIQGSNPD